MDNPGSGSSDRETHCRRALALASICSWRTDVTNGETVWTGAVDDVFGVSPENAPDDHGAVLEFVDPRDRETVARKREKIHDGEPFDIEYRIVVDETTKRVRERTDVDVDEAGQPTVATGVVQEITEYEERKPDLELFRSLVDRASDGLYVVDRQTGEILDCNETACQMLGYTYEELSSRRVMDIDPTFSVKRWNEFIETVREQGSKTIESKLQREDGTTFPVEIQVSYVSLDREYHVATVRDITGRKERERELEAIRERYETLVDAAPDPIFVANRETGTIIEANAAAAELRQQPREEIVGLHQTALHPADEADRYRDLFERHVESDGTASQFEDGSPVYLSTADGAQIPVAISTATVSVNGETLIHGIFRDISKQHRYQRSLEGINKAAQDLLHARTDAEIARTVVSVATDVLDVTGAAVYLYDRDAGELLPSAYSDRLESVLEEQPRFSPGDSIAWRVFAEQEAAKFDDVRTTEDVYNAGTPIRSELLVPLDEHGVFIVGDTEVGAFGDLTVEIAETLAATAEAALDRARQSQKLREQRRESKLQAERLERVHQLNERIRAILRVLVQAQSREAIEQQVCDALASLDQFAFAWIGRPDISSGEIDVTAHSGGAEKYLQAGSLDLSVADSRPAIRAIQTRTTAGESNIASNPQRGGWRNRALLYDFRSVISVPLVHNEVLYGVLTIYSARPESFDELTTAVLTELGELIGYSLNMADRRNALLDGGAEDVTFELTSGSDALLELADQLSTELLIQNITARSEETYLIHFVAENTDFEQVQAITERIPEIESVQRLTEGESARYEAILIGGCIVTTITDLGANLRSVTVDEDRYRLDVSIPKELDRQACNRYLKDQYPDLELIARPNDTSSSPRSYRYLLKENLTDRQRDILTTAYYSGYFEQPRERTGGEIAELLGISQPAFSKQLRLAQSNLLASILDGETPATTTTK